MAEKLGIKLSAFDGYSPLLPGNVCSLELRLNQPPSEIAEQIERSFVRSGIVTGLPVIDILEIVRFLRESTEDEGWRVEILPGEDLPFGRRVIVRNGLKPAAWLYD